MAKNDGGKLPKNNTISPVSLKDKSIYDGWATKEGGSVKSWKKRYFLLVPTNQGSRQGAELYYFKSDKEKRAIGVIKITEKSVVKETTIKGGRPCIEIDSGPLVRKYFMYCGSTSDQDKFLNALRAKIDALKTKDPKPAPTVNGTNPTPVAGKAPTQPASGIQGALVAAKNAVPFLMSETGDDRILEFWQIWTESIPSGSPEVSVTLVTNIQMSQLSWRVFGPQNLLIQEMVDFFWNVGAPEQEIDRLNDVGGLINPVNIGSWIDMSTKGGMDGGWVFPVSVNTADALKACDDGSPLTRLADWTQANNVEACTTVGRDMGASPPRQTEIRFKVKGDSFDARFNFASSAYKQFGFPVITDNYVQVLRSWNPPSMELSVITSSEGFVRIGMILPDPSRNILTQLCSLHGSTPDHLLSFQDKLKIEHPSFVEFQFLMSSFGYGVYDEGFNITFHYTLDSKTV